MDNLTLEELAAQEDAAWDEKERRDAESSYESYDEYMRDTQEGEFGPNKKYGSVFDYLVNTEQI